MKKLISLALLLALLLGLPALPWNADDLPASTRTSSPDRRPGTRRPGTWASCPEALPNKHERGNRL